METLFGVCLKVSVLEYKRIFFTVECLCCGQGREGNKTKVQSSSKGFYSSFDFILIFVKSIILVNSCVYIYILIFSYNFFSTNKIELCMF